MEALELSEALQRVRTSRRGQSDKEPERRVAHDTETRPQPGLERKGLETIGRGALPGRGGSMFFRGKTPAGRGAAARTKNACRTRAGRPPFRSSVSIIDWPP